ncbi:MAG: hypothetical protein GXP38_01530 [Chloroflexi bacterium]|nr:hypothetical protein [Chloroflexota bacterium]
MSLLAMINCTLLQSQGGVEQGLILLEGGYVRAVGRSEMVSVPVQSRLWDMKRGFVAGVRRDYFDIPPEIDLPPPINVLFHPNKGGSFRTLVAGMPAALVCYDRFGRLAWCVQKEVVSTPQICRQQRNRAAAPSLPLYSIAHFLQEHPSHIELHYVGKELIYQKKGVDFVWRFRNQTGTEQTIRIQVISALEKAPPGFSWLPQMHHSQADWCLYMFDVSRAYAIPLRTTRRWLQTSLSPHWQSQPPRTLFIPLTQAQAAIPRLQELDLSE